MANTICRKWQDFDIYTQEEHQKYAIVILCGYSQGDINTHYRFVIKNKDQVIYIDSPKNPPSYSSEEALAHARSIIRSLPNLVHPPLEFEIIDGLPEDYGIYLFQLPDGKIKQGLYSSFPHPHNNYSVRYADLEKEEFYYCNPSGWLKQRDW